MVYRMDPRTSWAAGETLLGGWISTSNSATTEVMARAGFDYLCIDNQHGLIGYQDTASLLQVAALGSSVPLVRVLSNNSGQIGQVLDAGAHGVIVPMVSTAQEARAAVAACRYAPDGIRSFGPNGIGMRDSGYYADANRSVLCIPMIETVEAIGALDEILAVSGVDAIYIGPADLSISLGLPPGNNDDDQTFTDALKTIVDACGRHGVVAGIHATPNLVTRRKEMGFQMITAVSDLSALRAGIAAARHSPDDQGSRTGY
jgi:4-hydroxy-2-oxoheptanedioate aldolase